MRRCWSSPNRPRPRNVAGDEEETGAGSAGCKRTSLSLLWTRVIGSPTAVTPARTRNRPPDNAARQVDQDAKPQQLEMNQSREWTQADMGRLRCDMGNCARDLRASISTIRQSDLLTNRLITRQRTLNVGEFWMDGSQWNKW
jgi:hypothetical protein